jgi:hypothetical protein
LAKTFVVLVAVAITLGGSQGALAQPEPDPAPVPAPPAAPPAPAPPLDTTPTTGAREQSEPNRKKRTEPKTAGRERGAAQAYSRPLHAPPADAGVTVAVTSTPLSATPSATPVATRATTEAQASTAAGIGVLLFLGAVLLSLAFAVIPASVLSRISVRLVERRQDIGLAMAVTLAATGAILVIAVAA